MVAVDVDGIGCTVVAPRRVGRGNEAPWEHCGECRGSEVDIARLPLCSSSSSSHHPPLAVVDQVIIVGRVRPRPRLHDMEVLAVPFTWGEGRASVVFLSGEGGRREREEEKR